MIAIQVLYFVAAAGLMGGVGIALMLPPLRRREPEQIMTRMIGAFGAKMLLGAGLLVLAWQGFGWTALTSAVGMIVAYIVALAIMTAIIVRTAKRTR